MNELIDILNKYNISFNIDEDNLAIIVNEDIEKQTLITFLKEFYTVETKLYKKEKTYNINLSLRKLNTEKLIEVFKLALNTEDLVDQVTILNIISLISKYNTLDDSFFANELIYFTSLIEFVDTKLEIKEELKEFTKNFAIYFYSLLKSCDKSTFTANDIVIDIPNIYQIIFQSLNFISICGIATSYKDTDIIISKCNYVNNSREILYNPIKNCVIGDTLLNAFLEDI